MKFILLNEQIAITMLINENKYLLKEGRFYDFINKIINKLSEYKPILRKLWNKIKNKKLVDSFFEALNDFDIFNDLFQINNNFYSKLVKFSNSEFNKKIMHEAFMFVVLFESLIALEDGIDFLIKGEGLQITISFWINVVLNTLSRINYMKKDIKDVFKDFKNFIYIILETIEKYFKIKLDKELIFKEVEKNVK